MTFTIPHTGRRGIQDQAPPSSFAQSVSICNRLISIKSLIETCPYITLRRRHVTGEPNP